MRGSYWVLIMMGMVLMATGCAGTPGSSKEAMLHRLEKLEFMQENSRRNDERLEKENSRLAERMDKLSLGLVNLALELERLQTPPVIKKEEKKVVVVPEPPKARDVAKQRMAPVRRKMAPVREKRPLKKERWKKKRVITPSAKKLYNEALHLLNGNKPAAARKVLYRFIKKYPQDPLLPNAYYWLGESYYDEETFVEAILAFKDVPDRFPKHAKAPDALFKIVCCYMSLHDRQNAKFYLEVLQKKYPRTKAARMAKKRFARLV